MSKCPLFGICGGCKFDFASDDYRVQKLQVLPNCDCVSEPVWGLVGTRRRADFVAAPGQFGFYKTGTRDIVNVKSCPNLLSDINDVVPELAALPWVCVASVLVTKCDNGIVVNVSSDVPYFNPEFRIAVQKLSAQIIRFTWNKTVIRSYNTPKISFGGEVVDFPDSAFLQPTEYTEEAIRNLVVGAVGDARHVADLFCGLGNFTFATNATGFDIVGTGVKRDLFKRPLTVAQLNQYDVVIMDPPRAGAMAQSKEIAKSNVRIVVYVSCNPNTWMRDRNILLGGGYKLQQIIPVDQFVGAAHWEIFSVFIKE